MCGFRIYIKSLFFFTLLLLQQNKAFSQNNRRGCASVEYNKIQATKDGTLEKRQQDIKEKIGSQVRHRELNKTQVTYVIPVVVHVLYNLTRQNISEEQIASQIDVLNEDYGRTNADTSDTPGPFKDKAGSVAFQFCLAQTDPDGKRTTGVVRKSTILKEFDLYSDNAKFTSEGGDDAWDATKYLNIWVVPAVTALGGDDVLGYTSSIGGAPDLDGVVIRFDCFGRTGELSTYYNKGRTTTHEVGHWFDLYHTWGDDGGGCDGSDLVDDTPNQAKENVGLPVFPATDPCSPAYPGIMYMNYMDYTDDAGMNMFTKGQVARMVTALEVARPDFKTTFCSSPEITEENAYPNPSKGLVFVDVPPASFKTINISVYNLMGALVSRNYTGTIVKGRYIIDLSEQTNGCYFVRVETDVHTFVKKVILWRK